MSDFDADRTEGTEAAVSADCGWELPRTPEAVSTARQRVREAMRSWGAAEDRIETAVLLVSELVTNAVEHAVSAAARVLCHLQTTAAGIRIRVWDDQTMLSAPVPDIPGPRRPAEDDHSEDLPHLAESGRGLLLVASLALSWGTQMYTAGRLVWADV